MGNVLENTNSDALALNAQLVSPTRTGARHEHICDDRQTDGNGDAVPKNQKAN
jgi:hypothetical protein